MVVGAVGAAIVYLALTHGQVALGGGVALVTVAGMVIAAAARQREATYRRAVAAAWKWWNDPEVQLRQWRLFAQRFAQPFADALPALEEATQHAPSDTDAWSRLAEVLNRVGRFDEALAASERALTLDPQHAFTWAREAGMLVNLRCMEEALASSERAIVLNPEEASAWANKGTALGHLGRYAEALYACDRAVALGIEKVAPWYLVTVRLTKSRLFFQLDRYDEALQACDQVLASQPNLVLAWYYKAFCQHGRGYEAEAGAAVLRAKELAV